MAEPPSDAGAPPSFAEAERSLRGRRSPLLVVSCALLPGILAGALTAGLLFFLNPRLPFSALPVSRALLLYGSILGLVSLVLLLPWVWGRPRRARRMVPWSLAAVLGIASVMAWTHASLFTFYIPGGINVRLIKAAVFVSLASLIAFYSALLHTAQRRGYSVRSRISIGVLCLVAVYVMLERREAFRPRTPPEPLRSVVAPAARPRVLVVGLECATLDAILPLAEQGRLPFFGRLLQEGTAIRLRALTPVRRAPLWTTLATGTLPYRHGILDSSAVSADLIAPGALLRLLPEGVGFEHWGTLGAASRPVDASLRATMTIWEIFSQLDMPSAVVGWPLLAPVPSGLRVALAEELFSGRLGDRYGAPPEIAERARVFRLRVEDLDPSVRSRFGPEVPYKILDGVAQDRWRSSLSVFLLEQLPELRAVFVVLPGLRPASRAAFGGWSAQQFEGVQRPVTARASQLIEAYYLTLDGMLEELWSKVEGPRLLAVVSSHGVEGAGRWSRWFRTATLRDPVGGHFDRGPDGLLLLAGDGVEPGGRIAGAASVDLVPTLLYGVGLPIARDLEGRVITEAFSPTFLARHPMTFVPSFETAEIRKP